MQWKITVTNPSLPNRAYKSNNGINWEIEPSSQPWNKLFEVFEENTNADIGIESLVNPGCNYNNAADVQVSLRNFSVNPIDFAITPATISGFAKTPTGNNLPFSFVKNSGTLAPGASENVTILQNYNFSIRGVHIFNARTNLSGDMEPNNDSLNFRFTNGLFIGKIPATSVCPITEVKLYRNNIYGNMQWSVNGSSTSTDTLSIRPVKSTTVYLSGLDNRGCTLLDSTVITVLTEGLPPRPILKNNSSLLNHRNEFKDTVRVNRLSGHTVQWFGGIGTVVSDTALVINQVSGLNGATIAAAYTRISDGCSNVSDTITYSYGAGVLFNSNTPLTVCDTSFYDSGGPLNLHNGNFTRTFTPAAFGTKMKFTLYGLSFPSFVNLEIFDGNSTSAPRIKALSSLDNGFEKREYISSNEDGVMTIRMSTSGIVSGWWGGLTCHKPEVYRTITNGNWNNPLIWEKKNITGMYVSSNSLPQKGDDSIYIRHNVLINNSYLIDQVVVEENGNLRIENPGTNFISINAYKVLPQPEFLVRGTLTLNDKVQIFGNGGYMEVKGNLFNAGNIDLDSVLFTGNQPQILGSPGFTGELKNLRISNLAGITLAGNQQVAGIRFDKGLINTDNIAKIILSNGESSTGAGTASYINGPAAIGLFGSGNRIYPIGKNGTYLPVELNCLDAQSFDNFETVTAEIISGAPAARSFPSGINAVSQVRYFTLSRDINNGTSYQITLPYTATEGVSDPAKLTIARGKGSSAWEDVGGTASGAAPGTIQSESFEELGEFVLANETGGTNGLLTALPDRLFDRVHVIRVYPNPAVDHIVLSFNDTWRTSPMHIQLLDMKGRLLKTWQFTGYSNGLSLWMGDIPDGNYMLDIRNDKYQKQSIQVIKKK